MPLFLPDQGTHKTMQKSTLILLVLSTLLVLGTEAQRRRSMNNFMANRFLYDLNLQCPYSLFRRGGRIPRAMINQAFTLADYDDDDGFDEDELDFFDEILDSFDDCYEYDDYYDKK